MNQIATEFLSRCFSPDETIALLLRRDNESAPTQRVVTLQTALAPRYLAWLAHENAAGANIYVAANPLHARSRKRTKENIASVRHLYIDIDADGDLRLAALRSADTVPAPSAILSTSTGKYQVLWQVEEFDLPRQEQTLKLLAVAFGGDPACTDCNRVLRIPGFLNRKYDPAHRVTVEYPDDSVWTPEDFRLDIGAIDAMLINRNSAPRKQPARHSNSESDWAWVCDQLAHGKDAMKLTRELASRRSDKPNPTLLLAAHRRCGFGPPLAADGVRIDDVITMLEVRRRFEFPNALCSARAREIAATARRMIVHRKTA